MTKSCADCDLYWGWGEDGHLCAKTSGGLCLDARADGGPCGPEAAYWVDRIAAKRERKAAREIARAAAIAARYRRYALILQRRDEDGDRFTDIAKALGVSPARVHQLYRVATRQKERREQREEGTRAARYAERQKLLGRVTDLDNGRMRDVWLTYGPSPDPRLDNFYPCGPGC